ncbi:cell envelope integrity protein TolA [Gammaproteobacteria bacterium]|jgi:colicin import membrane protein|nr:cell envelope integrity protein TolA [Gammaproteobacteria bacterium]
MKKFHPMALLLKFEGYPPAVIASVAMHACLFLFILGKSVDTSDFVTVEDPVIITASAIDLNPQRLRRLERLEQERVADQQRRQQAQRDELARQERERAESAERAERLARQERERQQTLEREQRQQRERQEASRQEEIARQRAAEDDVRRREQERLAQQQAEREAATRAAQEAQANQIASENLLVAEYAGIIKRVISQNWQIPPSARNGMMTEVRLQLVPTGEVVAVNIIQSSGNDVFDRSVLQAVERADRFSELQDLDNAVFERNFRTFTLVFRPEDLLR